MNLPDFSPINTQKNSKNIWLFWGFLFFTFLPSFLFAMDGFMLVQNKLQGENNTFFFLQIRENAPVEVYLSIKPKSINGYLIQKKWTQTRPEFQAAYRLEKGEYTFVLALENTETGEKALWEKEFECNPPENGVYLSDIFLQIDAEPNAFFSGKIKGENSVKSMTFSQTVRFPQPVLTARAILYEEKSNRKSASPSTAYTSLKQINQVMKVNHENITFSGKFDLENLPTGNYLIEILWYEEARLAGEKSISFSIVTEAYYWQERNIEESILKIKLLVPPEKIQALQAIQNIPEKKSALKVVWKTLYPNDSEQQAYLFYEKIRKADEKFVTEPLRWQSDKGIVYIKYGEPAETRKFHTAHGEYEGWKYPQWDLTFMFKQNGKGFTLVK